MNHDAAHAPIAVLGLGNDLLADDAIGILAARELAPQLEPHADVIATAEHGVSLLDLLVGYERVIVIDAVQTGRRRVGQVFEISLDELSAIPSPSPHYVGLPDLIVLAQQIDLPFPRDMRIVAVEVADVHTIGGRMTSQVRRSLPKVCATVQAWVDVARGQERVDCERAAWS